MAKARLLQAVCTLAILAATPAFAQTNTNSAPEAANGANAAAVDGMPEPGGSGQPSTMTPASRMGSSSSRSSSDAMGEHATHRSAMSGHAGRMHGRDDTSQNAAVDRLNEESYQAAQQGQTFSGSSMGQSRMNAPSGSGAMNGSGGMNGMSGNSPPGVPANDSSMGTTR